MQYGNFILINLTIKNKIAYKQNKTIQKFVNHNTKLNLYYYFHKITN
jgi:hypothetical protein